MYKYYQVGSRSQWVLVKEGPDMDRILQEAGARRLAILSVSDPVTDDTVREDQKYTGDDYWDIDGENISEAISSAQRLVKKLRDLGLPDEYIRMYASGGKGFHCIVPQTTFCSGR